MSFSIETIRPYRGSGIRFALFDFDGTISLIREGWQEIMIPYFTEVLLKASNNESKNAIVSEVTEFVDALTGKQTIYQCMALCDAVIKRGGTPLTPGEYKAEYLRRLELKIAERKQGLASGTVCRERYTVKGAVPFLRALNQAGIRCFLASGTDEEAVIYEAGLLGVAGFFNGGIHGARDDLTDCSKEAVIRELLKNQHAKGDELVCFGDGFVEIQLTAELGGYAVAVATNEKDGDSLDLKKRERLKKAGASLVIPHFEEPMPVLSAIVLAGYENGSFF